MDESALTERQKWWSVTNRGTDSLTWHQYAAAFSDVDSDTEWWDPTDWLAELFYSLVIEGIAGNGNCFGMSLEAIYSKKDRALLRLPLDRFPDSARPLLEALPAGALSEGLRIVLRDGDPLPWWSVGVLAAWATVGGILAARTFRWE